MNAGVIGTGSMGKNHLRVYSELKGVEEIYAFDPDKENVKVAGAYDAIVCDSMEGLLDQIDAVSIAVPTRYHFNVARSAIEKGISCLIEKPMTSTVKEGEELIRLLDESSDDVIVGVGHSRRSDDPRYRHRLQCFVRG
jgi:predicted dehydrogenase